MLTFRLYAASSGELLHQFSGHKGNVIDFLLVNGDKTLISSSFDNTIRVLLRTSYACRYGILSLQDVMQWLIALLARRLLPH